jgi:hypothetical protein
MMTIHQQAIRTRVCAARMPIKRHSRQRAIGRHYSDVGRLEARRTMRAELEAMVAALLFGIVVWTVLGAVVLFGLRIWGVL